ncbi:MAG: hypothetical protein ACFFDN_23450 [Candidatus Hodarchaeota archaeon]
MSDDIDKKIIFIGDLGVGKRTIIHMLLELKILPFISKKGMESVIKKGKLSTSTNIFNAMLISITPDLIMSGKHNSFIHNSNLIVFVVTKFREMLKCKQHIDALRELSPNVEFCVIANKQDLEESLNPTAAMKFFELPTIGICAIMPEHRETLVNFLNEFIK